MMAHTGMHLHHRQTTEDRLFDAIENGDHYGALELVKRADLTAIKDGYTLVHHATIHNQSKVVGAIFKKMLNFAKFCKLKVKNEASKFNGMTALEIARKLNFPKVERSLEGAITVEKYQTDLHKAAKCGDRDMIRRLYRMGHDVNKRGKFGETPLHVACGAGHLDAVKTLLEVGADYTIPTKTNVSVIYTAACWGHLTILKYLLQNCPDLDVNCRDDTYETALHGATDYGSEQIYNMLLEKKANHVANRIGETPTHLAAYRGHLKILYKLLQRPDDEDFLNERTLEGNTPLHYAVHGGRCEVTTYLVREGADVNARNIHKTTPLHLAAVRGHLQICHLLLRHGADVNAAEKTGDTALHEAADHGNLPIIETLVENGINVNAKNNSGELPLHKAAKRGHLATVKFFLEFGAPIDAQTRDGDTPLILAAGNGNTVVVECLLKHHASVDLLRNDEDKTYGARLSAFHVAVIYGHVSVVRVFLANGVPMQYDGCSLTPLHCAAMNADKDMIEEILGSTDEIIGKAANVQHDHVLARRASRPNIGPMSLAVWQDYNANKVGVMSNGHTDDDDDDDIGEDEDEIFRRQFQDAYARRRSSRRGSANNLPAMETAATAERRAPAPAEFEISDYRIRRGSAFGGDDVTPEEEELLKQRFQVYSSGRRSSRGASTNEDESDITPEEDEMIRRQFQGYGGRSSRPTIGQDLTGANTAAGQLGMLRRRSSVGYGLGSRNLNGSQMSPTRLGMPRQSIAGPLGLQELFSGNWSLVDIPDSHGRSPLHVAAEKGSVEAVQVLLDNGADVNMLSKQKRTPLHLAAARGHTEVVKLLLDEGCEIDLKDRFNDSAIALADNNRQDDVVYLLQDRGAKEQDSCIVQ